MVWIRTGLRRLAMSLTVGVLLALIALEGGVLWLQTPSGNHFLRRTVEDAVTEAMGEGELRVGELSTDLFHHLRLSDVSLDDGTGRGVVTVDHLVVDWRATELLQRQVALDRVVLDRPVVDLQTDGDGVLDLLRMFPSDPDAPPFVWEGLPVDIRLGELAVHDGAVSYTDGETHVALADVEVGLRASASGRDVTGDSLVVEARLVAPLELPVSARGDVRFVDGDLVVDGVVAAVGDDAVRLEGIVRDLEDPDALALEGVHLAGVGLDLDRVEGWAGELGIGGLVGVTVDVAGPLDAVDVDARVQTAGGAATAAARLDLAAPVPTWAARVDTEGFECQGLVDAVTESLLLNGTLELAGTGLAFPDGVEATGALDARPSVIWGYPLDGGSAGLRWTEGRGLIDAFEGDMGWGSATGSGELTLTGTTLAVQADVHDLHGLAVFAVEGIGGRASSQGDLVVDWSGVEAEVRFDGATRVVGADVQEVVQVGLYTGSVHTSVIGQSVEVSGSGRATDVDVSGALVESIHADWQASVRPDGAFRWQADVSGGPLDVAGFLGVERIRGTATGEDDGVSEPRILAELALIEAHLGAIRGDTGKLVVGLQGDALQAVVQLQEDDADRLTLQASGDLGTGWYEVPRLALVPPENEPWTNPGPLRAHVVEGGVEDLYVVLGSEAGRLALTGDFVAGERVDLLAVVEGFHLDWIEALALDTTKGWGGVAAANVRLEGVGEGTRLDAQVAIDDLVVPGQIQALDVELGLAGAAGELTVLARVADDDQALLWGGGTVPVSVDPDAPGPVAGGAVDLHLEGGPWDVAALGEHLPALAGLGIGQASGELELGGVLVAPTVDLALGLELGVGAPAEWVRVDLDLHEADGQLVLSGMGRQGGAPQLLIEGTALTGLEQVLLGALVPGEPQPDTDATATWVSDLDLRVVPINVDLATWARAFEVELNIQGLLAGGVRLTGSVERPEVVAGLQVTEMVLGEVPVSPALIALGPDPDNGGYRTTLVMGAGDGNLSVAGLVPFELDSDAPLDLEEEFARDGLDLEVGGTGIPVALLQLFDAGITEPSGELEVLGVIEGSVADPDPVVSFSVVDGSFNYEPLLVKYTDLDLLLVLDHQELTVEQARVLTEPLYTDFRESLREATQGVLERTRVGDTRLEATVVGDQRASRTEPQGGIVVGGRARLGLEGLSDVDLAVGANFAWIMDTTGIVVAYTGDVTVTGDWPGLAVRGDVGLDKLRYTLDARSYLGQEGLRLDPTLSVERPGYVQLPPQPVEPDFWEAWDIQAAVDLGFNTKIDVSVPLDTSYGTLTASASNVQLISLVRGELDVVLKGFDVYAEGAVETFEGTTRILGKSFGIKTGVVTFAGSEIENPALDIQATHETSQYGDVSVRISNNVEQLALAFDSTEGWSETDIVAILLLGHPTSKLGQAEGGAKVEALDIALGMVAGQVEQLAGENLVDTIEIQTGGSDEALQGIKAGWAVGRNLFLTVSYTAAADDEENRYEAELEWIPVQSWHVAITSGDRSESSLEVFKVWNF